MAHSITIPQQEKVHPFQKCIDLQQREWSSAPLISLEQTLFLQSNGVYWVFEIMQKQIISFYNIQRDVLKLKEFYLPPCYPPCKWQHNESRIIPGEQTASCFWGSPGHPKIPQLFQMPARNCEGGREAIDKQFLSGNQS